MTSARKHVNQLAPTVLSSVASNQLKGSVMIPEQDFVWLYQPRSEASRNMDLVNFVTTEREAIVDLITKHGMVLFRGFNIDKVMFKELSEILKDDKGSLDFVGATSPRREVLGENEKKLEGIFESTVYPNHLHLLLHHEFGSRRVAPSKIFFYCETPSEQLGQTPICFERQFVKHLPAKIYDLFEKREVMYVRNYIPPWTDKWQNAFGSDDKMKVEEINRSLGVDTSWRNGDEIRCRHVSQGVAYHPKTKERIFFNQAYTLNFGMHSSGKISPYLLLNHQTKLYDFLKERGHEDAPFTTLYGDGTEIDPEILFEIHNAFGKCSIDVEWMEKDFAILDNMLVTHGRKPYYGQRRILISMGDLIKVS